MEGRSHPVNALPAVIACVAIAFGALAAERKLDPRPADGSAEERGRPLLVPAAPLTPLGDTR